MSPFRPLVRLPTATALAIIGGLAIGDLRPLARLEAHPGDPTLLGLKNLSGEAWHGQLSDGRSLLLEPGRTCNLAALQQLRTGLGPITLHR